MAKYKRVSTGYYARRASYLASKGFLDWEIQEIVYGSRYSTFKRNKSLGNTDPAIYLQRAIKARILYVGNLQRKGYTPEQIKQSIERLYVLKDWMSAPKGFVGVGVRRDPFMMIREFRKVAIESGDYRRPPKKGSHHSLKRRDIDAQRQRRERNTTPQTQRGDVEKNIAKLNAQINDKKTPKTQIASLIFYRDNLMKVLRRLP